MFDDTVIVQSAISAFNNVALVAPGFLWSAILSVPLFLIVYYCGDAFMQRFGWTSGNINRRVSIITVLLILGRLLLFGGNYAVLRDNLTVLPFAMAGMLFLAAMFIGAWYKELKIPQYRNLSRWGKFCVVIAWVILFAVAGLSDMHAWWGPIMQISALGVGIVLGRMIGDKVRDVPFVLVLMFGVAVLLLMQPEFFRFGQLGALTPFHLLALVLMSMAVMATFAVRMVRPRGRIRHSVYVKLKWLLRLISVLCMALFVLTESVPVFIGMSGLLFVVFIISVWHASSINAHLGNRMFAIALMLFGVLTTMPAISALGILRWVSLPTENRWQQLKFLL